LERHNETDLQTYSLLGNMRWLAQCTKEYLPSLLWWTAASAVWKLLIPLLEMYLPKLIIDALAGGGSLQRLLLLVLSAALGLALLGSIAKLCEKYVYHKKILMGSFYIHQAAHKGLVCDYASREAPAFRSLQQESCGMCQGNESTLRNVYYAWIDFFSGVAGFVLFSGVLSTLHIAVLLFLAAGTVAEYFIGLQVTKWTAENNAERTAYHHKLGCIDEMAKDIPSAKDIRLYGMAAWFQSVYRENMASIAKWYKRYDKIVLRNVFAGASVSLLREGVAYGYLIYLAFSGRIDAGGFVLYFAAITGFSAWLGNIFSQLAEMKHISLYVTKFRNYLAFPDTFRREGGVSADGKLAAPCTIELRNVCYRYPGAESDTLHNINLTIQAGEHLAIVGLNGAGKTTLVKLLCGLIDPTGGEIQYDGIGLKAYNRIAYYRLFAAVFQQYSLLPLSIEEAVAEASVEQLDGEKVQACLITAGLWEKIAALPNGAKSMLDKSVNDDAVTLSGGETQKLLLARAVYRDAPVLLLDEPTAALDALAENRLYESYHAITEKKTAVFISHRLASTRFCDRILLLNGGRIAESGTHAQLLQAKGVYAELFEAQAKYYREEAAHEAEK